VTADKPESQEICFIPDNDYRGFLRNRIPGAFRPGPIVDAQGSVLGEHQGLVNYTVGQRRGLGLSGPRPLYVTALDPRRNALVVGGTGEVETDRLWAEQVNLIAVTSLDAPLSVTAKIRHGHVPAPATIRSVESSRTARVEVHFDRPQRAVAPGQSVVFYQGDLVVGGGVIAAKHPEDP
jgi:tRNA-specific 2-thiouridylase